MRFWKGTSAGAEAVSRAPEAGSPPGPGRDAAVRVEGVGKRFDIYPNDRARVIEFFGNRRRHREFWALKDVSFQVPKGGSFGVIGSNGAGKSTLLRLLSGVSRPTEGHVDVGARMSGLLDLGLGFHRDFTGRENIFLNCALLGLTDEETRDRVPRIIEFAELEEFIDYPVRTYSAGMNLRLGFAIACHVDYDVFLIDEVLAVGDQYFQRKCVRKIEEFIAAGRTLVLVSHDLHAVRSLCEQAIWLHAGRVVGRGAADDVVRAYIDVARDREDRVRARLFAGATSADSHRMAEEGSRSLALVRTADADGGEPEDPATSVGVEYRSTLPSPQLREAVIRATALEDAPGIYAEREEVAGYDEHHRERPLVTGTGEVRILSVRILDAEGREVGSVHTFDALTIAVTFKTRVPVERPVLGVALFRNDDVYVFGPNTRFDAVERLDGVYDGVYTYFIHYPRLTLLAGTYFISVAAYDKNHLKPHVWHNQLYEVRVDTDRPDHGLVHLDHHWGLVIHARGEGERL